MTNIQTYKQNPIKKWITIEIWQKETKIFIKTMHLHELTMGPVNYGIT